MLTEGLQQTWDGTNSAAIITGAAGIGKSRLAQEALSVAQLIGFTTVTITPYTQPRLQSATSFATELTSSLINLPGSLGASPNAIGIAHRLTRKQPTKEDSHQDAGSDQLTIDAIAWSISELIAAATTESPLAVLIDDMHTLSDSAATLTVSLLRDTATARIAWILAGREKPSELPGRDHLVSIELSYLSAADSHTLADYAWAQKVVHASSKVDAAIAHRSGGNPFYIRALANAANIADLPPQITKALQAHYLSLTETERDLIHLVHFLGPSASTHRIAQLANLSFGELARLLDRLDGYHGVLTNSSHGKLRLHDIWAEQITHNLSQQTTALLALRVASLLATQQQDLSHDSVAWLAHLFSLAGLPAKARSAFQLAGDSANDKGLTEEALHLFAQALAADSQNPAPLELGCRIATAKLRTSQLNEALETCNSFLNSFVPSYFTDASARALMVAVKAEVLFRLNLPYLRELKHLQAALESSSVPSPSTDIALLIGMRLSLNACHHEHAERLYLLSETRRNESQHNLPLVLTQLMFCAEYRDSKTLEETAMRADNAALLCPQPQWRVAAAKYVSTTYRWLGEYERSGDIAMHGIEVARRTGLLDEVFSLAIQCCNMNLDFNNEHDAIRWHREALQVPTQILSPERLRALAFTSCRLSLRAGHFEKATHHYSELGIQPEEDQLRRRAALDAAILGLACLGTQHIDEAAKKAVFILDIAGSLPLTPQLDFAIDAAAYISHTLDLTSLLASLRLLAAKRAALARSFIAPSFVHLLNITANQDA